MRLVQIQKLLDDNNIGYIISHIKNLREYRHKQGFLKANDNIPVLIITIPNPNHSKNIELIFESDDSNPVFVDMEFGGYWNELFDCRDEWIESFLTDEIQNILNDKVYVIFARDEKTGAWFFDANFHDLDDELLNDMDEFNEYMKRIHSPKNWLRKLTGRVDRYEIFNWTNYQCIIK